MRKKIAGSPGIERKQAQLKRRMQAPEALLAPVLVDHSTVMVTPDVVIHSNFQARPPVDDEPTDIDTVLVGRFAYGPAHFKALTALMVRQFLVSEVAHHRDVADAAAFLRKTIDETTQKIKASRPDHP